MALPADNLISPRWIGWWSKLTVAAVCPLLLLGALVTTMGVGMADQRGMVLPHQAIQEFSKEERGLGWKIEHSHRLAGWFAGVCGIGLAIGFWLTEKQGGWRWLGLGGLGLIGVQGLLGIFRVSLHAWWGPGLAWVHGLFAQIVFAALVGLALLVSRGWHDQPFLTNSSSQVRGWSLLCVLLVFVQLILGGLLRHQPDPSLLLARLHMVGAFLVLGILLWLIKLAGEEPKVFRWSLGILMVLLMLQILLGVEAGIGWLGKYFDPSRGIREPLGLLLVRTGHYFVGSLLFANTVVLALKAHRLLLGGRVLRTEGNSLSQAPTQGALVGRLEGAL